MKKKLQKKIIVKVNNEKICLIGNESNFITGYSKLKYYYFDLNEINILKN